jgi:hypothetical protein
MITEQQRADQERQRNENQQRKEANNARIVDSRDKSRFAHGKMKRSGVYATRKRT